MWYLIVLIPDLCRLSYFDHEERVGCFILIVILMSFDCSVALPGDATGWSAVCGALMHKCVLLVPNLCRRLCSC